jgi:uncharacterized protein YjhX (UPF0386 family)
VDRDDSVASIVFARQQHHRFELLKALIQRIQFALDLAGDDLALFRELKERIDIGGSQSDTFRISNRLFEAFSLLHHALAFFGLVPELRVGNLFFEFC